MKQNRLTVIDFFCGAGGFSEGFRQKGFEIIHGYDHWKPAIDTYNHNFNLNCSVKNILDFKFSIDAIEELPDTDVIIGSPPCVSFSSSNKSGKADKSLGVELTETFLRIVAVKKHQPNSKLKAWFMENVVNSRRYLQPSYTFKDLGLGEWAASHRLGPGSIAIELAQNSTVINSADYGSIQARKRVISGEIIKKRKLIIPQPTHSRKGEGGLPIYNSLNVIKRAFPSPFEGKSNQLVRDVQYPIELELKNITDHFYDTGIYEREWRFSKYWKTNHPFMGRMSFPEDENKPSRTITATRIANSRESIVYKSEIKRAGDGEYRLPTVREAAIIMGFPVTYQFVGSESSKWRLVGNAVCASVSRSFASTVLGAYKREDVDKLNVVKYPKLDGVVNLNTFSLKRFDNPPTKNKNARCRLQPLKDGNLTVTLSNYSIAENQKADRRWRTSIQYGTGKGFPMQQIEDGTYVQLEEIIKGIPGGKKFLDVINNGFSEKIGTANQLQAMFENQANDGKLLEPMRLIEEVKNIIDSTAINASASITAEVFLKPKVPIKQVFALYAVNKISSIANTEKI